LGELQVNPINEQVADDLTECFKQLADDPEVKAVILKGEDV